MAHSGSLGHPGGFDPDLGRKKAQHMHRMRARTMMAKPILNTRNAISRAAMAATFAFQDRGTA
jgi:hypothetical protein|tara:strand:+ start:269 stop:457 length:189 start_codon:yes stop_codon:yes gene_type:complete